MANLIEEHDVGKLAWPLRLVRWNEPFVFSLYALTISEMPSSILLASAMPDNYDSQSTLLTNFFILTAGVLSLYAMWRHVGVIDSRAWPYLAASCLVQIVLAVFGAISPAVGAFIFGATGIIALTLLWRLKIPGANDHLATLLDRLRNHERSVPPKNANRVNPTKGYAWLILGVTLLLLPGLVSLTGSMFMVNAVEEGDATNLALGGLFVGGAGIFGILIAFTIGYIAIGRSRRFFQIKADSLLGVDRRPPILFLRSFEDDQVKTFSRAWMDFSLETRLANHFMSFGPFLAVGSPGEGVPQPGAARIYLDDDKWQEQVRTWMRNAQLVVLYAGSTKWVNWELQQILEVCPEKLVLLMPESKKWFIWRRAKDAQARLNAVRSAASSSPWREAFAQIGSPSSIRAISLVQGGRLAVIRSGPRNRDSYQLSAMVLHDGPN